MKPGSLASEMSPITQSQHPGYDTEGTLTLGTKTCGYVGADM